MPPVVEFVAIAVTWLKTAGWAQTLAKIALSYGLTSVVQRQLARNSAAGSFQNEAARRLTTVRASAEPRRIVYGQVRMGGVMTYAETHGEDNKYLNLIVTLTGHEINAISSVLWGDETLTFSGSDGYATNASLNSSDGPLLFVSKNLGTDAQTADGDLTGLGLSWTSNHRQRGCANLYVRAHADAELLTDLENITAIVQGKKVYDPRTATTVYSNNAALVTADYLMDTRYGFGIPLAKIDAASLTAAANVCDESVTLNPSGTEKRYTINGSFDSSAPRGKVLQDMANAMAGSVVYSAGKYYMQAGAYTAPTVTLTDDHLRGGLQIKTLDSVSECVNRVRGIYANPQANYQVDDFPTVVNATYLSEDNGEEHWRDIELPFTTSYATAQRLAKIDLERSRQEITIQYPAQLHALQLRAGDTVAITNSRLGWTSKVFDVLELKPIDDDGYIGIDLILKETASTVYTWANGEETVVDPAPNTDLPDPTTVPAPTGLSVSSGTADLILKGDGTVISRAHLTWTRPASTFAGRIEVEYKLSSGDSSAWVQFPWLSASVVDFYIADVTDGADYDFRVRSVSVLGYRSSWATVSNHTIVGKTAAPAVPSGLTLTAIVEGIKVIWTQTTELDVLHGGRVWIERADDAAFTLNTDLISTLPDGEHVLRELYPGQEYYVRIKHVDSTGNASAYTSGISARVLSSPIDVPAFWGARPIGGASDMTFELNKNSAGSSSNRSVRILGNVYVDTEGTSWPVYGPTSVSTPYTSGSIYPEYGETGFDGSELPGRDGAFYIAHLESSAENYWPLGNFGGAEDETFFVAVAPYQQTWVATDGDGNYWTLPVSGVTIVAKVERQPGASGITGIIPMTTALEKPIALELEFPTIAAMKAHDFTAVAADTPVRVKNQPKLYYDPDSSATADDVLVFDPTTGAGRVLRGDVKTVKSSEAGAAIDGSTDDTLKIQAAIDSGAKIIIFEPGDHLVTAQTDTFEALTVTAQSNLEFIFEPGARIISDNASNSIEGLVIEGANDDTHSYSYSNLASNASRGDKTLALATGEGVNFTAGDWVKLVSDGLLDGPMGEISKKKGELVQVDSVSTDTLTLKSGILDAYATADTAKVAVAPMVSNITIRGLRTDTIWRSLVCRWVENLTIIDPFIENQVGTSGCGIAINDCVNVKITNTTAKECAWYGIQVDRSSRNVLIDGITGEGCRHVVTTLANDTYGQVRNLTVRNGWANNSALSAWDTHEAGENILYENLYSMEDGDHGIQVRAFRVKAKDCVIEKSNADSYSVEYEVGTEIEFINCKSRYAGRDGIASKAPDTLALNCDMLDSTNRGYRFAGGRIRGGSAERNASAAVTYNNNATRAPLLIEGLYAPKSTEQTTFLAGGDGLNLDLKEITVLNCVIPGYAYNGIFASGTGDPPFHQGNQLFQDATKTQGIATLTNGEVAVSLAGLIVDSAGGSYHRPVVPNIQLMPLDGDYPGLSFDSGDVDTSNEWITGTDWEDYYTFGAAFLYIEGSGVVGGLTDGETYFAARNSFITGSGQLRLTEIYQLTSLDGGFTAPANGATLTVDVDDSSDFVVGRYAIFENGSGNYAYLIDSIPSGTEVVLQTMSAPNAGIVFPDNEPVYLGALNITSAAGSGHLLTPTGPSGNSPIAVAGLTSGTGFRIKSAGPQETGRKVRWQLSY
jgi:hypothetical protein